MKNRYLVTPKLRTKNAFTLIELMVVIAIIATLAAITSRVLGSVNEMQNRSRASAEIATIGTGLEAFKSMYNDYPRLNEKNRQDTPQRLLRCLSGITYMSIEQGQVVLNDIRQDTNLKYFVDPGTVTIGSGDEDHPEVSGITDTKACFVDPWGVPYHYYYNSSLMVGSVGSWEGTSFILLSSGPDKMHSEVRSMYSNGMVPEDSVYRDAQTASSKGIIYPNVDNIVYGFEN